MNFSNELLIQDLKIAAMENTDWNYKRYGYSKEPSMDPTITWRIETFVFVWVLIWAFMIFSFTLFFDLARRDSEREALARVFMPGNRARRDKFFVDGYMVGRFDLW